MERERNNTGLVVAVTILAMLVVGLVGFIIYDKVTDKPEEPNIEDNDNLNDENNNDNQSDNNDQPSEEKEEIKEISIKDKLVISLKYPMPKNNKPIDCYTWEYKNVTIDTISRTEKMVIAAYDLSDIGGGDGESERYLASSVERKFKQIFGPDTDYYNGEVDSNGCCLISEYNKNDKTYLAYCGCGCDPSDVSSSFISKKYKAEQSDNYLYVYEHVVKVGSYTDYDTDNDVYYYENLKTGERFHTDENYKSEASKLMNEGKLGTYKWTFKKQSDGKYYFYSGAWEN